jgi:hypothetical protein
MLRENVQTVEMIAQLERGRSDDAPTMISMHEKKNEAQIGTSLQQRSVTAVLLRPANAAQDLAAAVRNGGEF